MDVLYAWKVAFHYISQPSSCVGKSTEKRLVSTQLLRAAVFQHAVVYWTILLVRNVRRFYITLKFRLFSHQKMLCYYYRLRSRVWLWSLYTFDEKETLPGTFHRYNSVLTKKDKKNSRTIESKKRAILLLLLFRFALSCGQNQESVTFFNCPKVPPLTTSTSRAGLLPAFPLIEVALV